MTTPKKILQTQDISALYKQASKQKKSDVNNTYQHLFQDHYQIQSYIIISFCIARICGQEKVIYVSLYPQIPL